MPENNDDKTRTHVVLTKGTQVRHYQIVEKIGAGGMGEVYLADDTRLGRRVALKFLPAEMAQDADVRTRFRREAQAAAQLDHPNIVTIYEVDEFEERPYFAMQYIEGKTLHYYCHEQPLEVKQIIRLALQVAEGLSRAHEAGIVHRDIKAANIVIDHDLRPIILDFGLAAVQGSEMLTKAGSTLGTVAYMSPEQAKGETLDHRSDLFSLGVVMYELIAGRAPLKRENDAATLNAILSEEPEPLVRYKNDVPSELQRIISRCMAKNLDERYQSAADLAAELRLVGRTLESGSSDSIMPSSAGQPSIAVLPFTNMSTDPEQEYFCDGIAEDILNDLAGLEGLQVVSRTSSFAFKGKTQDLRDVGRKLNAGTILEGSVRKAGNRLRITAQLIKVTDGYHLWSERYDRELDDVFAIQDEIAAAIVKALRVKLHAGEEVAKGEAPTRNIEAYELYLRGRIFFHESGQKGLKAAIDLFSRAIKEDPDYALAYAGLAESLSHTFLFMDSDESNVKGAMEASKKALELNPNLAEAHAARGLAVSLGKQYEEAEAEFEKAIELNPHLFEAYYHYARACFVQGKHERACELFEKASELKPDDYQSPMVAAGCYLHLGQKEKAIESQRKGLKIAKRRLEINPNDVRALYLGAGALFDLGETEKAFAWSRRVLEIEPNDPGVLYNSACLHSSAGRTDEAMDLLKRAISNGFSSREWIENDSDLVALRQHPEYEAMLASIPSQ